MARLSDALRQQVTERARGLCEYCQTAQLVFPNRLSPSVNLPDSLQA
jgi:hypothetical protein